MASTEIPPASRRRSKRRRLLALFGIGAILFLAASAYLYFWLARPVGSGPAGPSAPRAAFEQTWSTREVLLLGVGDSVTKGLGASPGRSYFDRLLKNPPDEFADMRGICLSKVLPNLKSLNLALSGSNSLQHLEILEHQLEIQPYSTVGLVVVTTGGNDLIHSYGRKPPQEGAMYGATMAQAQPWIAAFEQRLHQMIDRLEAAFPGGCQIFLADIYDPTDGVGDAQNAGLPPWPDGLAIHAAYNRILHECADQRASVHLVPMHQEFLGHGIHCRQFWRSFYRPEDPHYWYWVNLEDPNNRGYDAIRRLFLIEIAKQAPKFSDEHNPFADEQ